MSVQKTISVNSNGLNNMIFDINDYSIKIRNIFNEIESIVVGTKNYYKCNSADAFRNSFNVFKSNFPVMTNNLLTYKKDLQSLKKMFTKQENILSNLVDDKTRIVRSKNIK